ncbi:unnamed protein product [Meloidogyne enterolobii]|uniref:Uncharacterized protein n=1 Tax=Meloidogyne enterolobii TaxID=390850 RepID=A0ACB0Z630_MELEN
MLFVFYVLPECIFLEIETGKHKLFVLCVFRKSIFSRCVLYSIFILFRKTPLYLSFFFQSEKKVKKVKKKSRTGSEASSFDQKTIQEFKEAFAIMDQDKDGVISKGDLKDLYATLGSIASESQIDAMLKEAPGPINFTVFLTLFGERLTGTDPEATIVGAFQMWDKSDSGFITEEALMKILKNKRGEPLSEDEVQSMYKGNPPISGGK